MMAAWPSMNLGLDRKAGGTAFLAVASFGCSAAQAGAKVPPVPVPPPSAKASMASSSRSSCGAPRCAIRGSSQV
jgi:hypothetical protein